MEDESGLGVEGRGADVAVVACRRRGGRRRRRWLRRSCGCSWPSRAPCSPSSSDVLLKVAFVLEIPSALETPEEPARDLVAALVKVPPILKLTFLSKRHPATRFQDLY